MCPLSEPDDEALPSDLRTDAWLPSLLRRLIQEKKPLRLGRRERCSDVALSSEGRGGARAGLMTVSSTSPRMA